MCVIKLVSLLMIFFVIHHAKSVTYRQLYQNRNYYIGLVFSYLNEVITDEKTIRT